MGFLELDLTGICQLTFFAPPGAIMEMLGASCGRYNEDDIMSYKRLANTSWACTSEYDEPPQHDNDVRLSTRQNPAYRVGAKPPFRTVQHDQRRRSHDVGPCRILAAGLDLINIRHLTFFAPLTAVIEMLGILPGTLYTMMGYK
ncbi:hypothetical protein LTR97_012142 [Elasticomyces elasticus]|uniref:Uncharacterized protein n=1 Tax=Elasticomyces elasticus TaxID=574655 RepID=A0AAN7ZV86_9PEZI|nr:hypothetical protein LTR97_012142 [Elasticomyces elasticus]